MSLTFTATPPYLAIGEVCFSNADCGSGLCFFGSPPLMGVKGTCQCDYKTNTGCDDGETCIHVDPGVPPICTACGDPTKPCMDNWEDCRQLELGGCSSISEKVRCPLQFACEAKALLELGSPCQEDFECQSGVCSEFSSLVQPRACVCNLQTNAGCSAIETCVVLGDMNPSCALSLGSPCDPGERSKCVSGFCLYGICQCNPITHTGCEESKECVGDDSVGYLCNDAAPLLPIGAPCQFDNSVCDTDRCFFSFDSSVGRCSCNTDTDAGCPLGTECVVDVVRNGAPYCALPDDAACEVEGQKVCSNGGCCKSGICRNGVCMAAPLTPFGSKCRENPDCDTQYCYHGIKPPDTAGTCECNPVTNGGCPDFSVCVISDQIADIPPFCGLPLESSCNTVDLYDCISGNCFEGTCQCALYFNTGCKPPQVCLGDETVGYKCVDPYVGDEPPLKAAPIDTPTLEPTRVPRNTSTVADSPTSATRTEPDSAATQGQRTLLGIAFVLSALLIL